MAERTLVMDRSKVAGNLLKSAVIGRGVFGALRVSCVCILLWSISAVGLRAQEATPDPCAAFNGAPVAKSQSLLVASAATKTTTKTITLTASGQEPLTYKEGKFEKESEGGGSDVTETLLGSGPKLSVQIPAGSSGIYKFTFSVTDPAKRTSSKDGTVYITVLPDTKLQNPPADQAPAADSFESATKKALASEWGNPDEAQNVLNALQLLTNSANIDRLDCKVLEELKGSNPYDPHLKNLCKDARSGKPPEQKRQGLYVAALGNPNDSGQPTAQGLPDFVDLLAKANRLELKAPGDENILFACTKSLIDKIFQQTNLVLTPFPDGTKKASSEPRNIPGSVVLVSVDSSFKANDPYVALYLLLDSFTPPSGTCVDKVACAAVTEDLRAAFEMDSASLAKQVSDKIGAQKQP